MALKFSISLVRLNDGIRAGGTIAHARAETRSAFYNLLFATRMDTATLFRQHIMLGASKAARQVLDSTAKYYYSRMDIA